MDSFIARQPIFDREVSVVAYELLSRSGPSNIFDCAADADQATDRMVSDVIGLHGLDAIASGQKMFVNLTRSNLLSENFLVLPPGQTVLELLEDVRLDAEVLAACRTARTAGYQVALDDYVLQKDHIRHLDEFDIVKIDFLQTQTADRRWFLKDLARLPCRFLAEKVEDHEQYQEAAELGFAYYQGFFFLQAADHAAPADPVAQTRLSAIP